MGDIHNEIKYATGTIRAVRLGTGIGEGEGLVRVDESLTIVSDWWERADWAILAGDALAWGRADVAAGGAGLRSMLALVNPTGSGRLFIVQLISSSDPDATIRVLAPAPVVGVGGWTAATAQGTRDLRGSLPARLLTNNTVAAVGSSRFQLTAAGQLFELPIVIGPNTSIIVEPNADNALLSANIAWRERLLLPGEPPNR